MGRRSRYHETDKKRVLKGKAAIGAEAEARPNAKKGAFAWELDAHDGSRTYYFRCADADERRAWLGAVEDIVDFHVLHTPIQ